MDNDIVYATIWRDSSVGKSDLFFARSEDGGETFDKPINVSNNEKYALVESDIAVYPMSNMSHPSQEEAC
jgi:hypothetical protein